MHDDPLSPLFHTLFPQGFPQQGPGQPVDSGEHAPLRYGFFGEEPPAGNMMLHPPHAAHAPQHERNHHHAGAVFHGQY